MAACLYDQCRNHIGGTWEWGCRGKKWVSVLMFLWYIYMSCAEVLPKPMLTPRAADKDAPFHNDDEFTLRTVNSFMNSLERYHHSPDMYKMGPGTFDGPKRYLQKSTRTDAWQQPVGQQSTRIPYWPL